MKRNRQPLTIFIGLTFIVAGALLMFLNQHYSAADQFYGYNSVMTVADETPQLSQQEFAHQVNETLTAEASTTPLLLQSDEAWAESHYGNETGGTIRANGCALLSLAMVLSHHRGTLIDPNEIFQWAGDRYFINGSGTAWTIFGDFAAQYNLDYHDLGNDLNAALPYLDQQIPVIVSVQPGQFTTGGHIMVLRRTENGLIRLLDPDDTPERSHYSGGYSPEEIAAESIHYWTFTAKG